MATHPHGAPYPVGTDRVADGDNAIQALAKWADDRATLGGTPAPLTAATRILVYSASLLFGPDGVGRFDWTDPKPVNIAQVYFMHNIPNFLYLWQFAPIGPVGFNNTSVYLAGGPANGTVPFIQFLVFDRV